MRQKRSNSVFRDKKNSKDSQETHMIQYAILLCQSSLLR